MKESRGADVVKVFVSQEHEVNVTNAQSGIGQAFPEAGELPRCPGIDQDILGAPLDKVDVTPGLLSEEPMEKTVAGLDKLQDIAKELGCKIPAPFSALSFMALPVIPELRLTDLGLVDVNEFKLIE